MGQRNNRLYIFSFKLIIFLAIILFVVYKISFYISINRDPKIDNARYHLERTKDKVNYDLFYFSNSYLYTAIDPFYLKHLTGITSLSFCSPSQRTLFTTITLKNILEEYQPKCIIVDLSNKSTYMPSSRKDWSFNLQGLLSSEASFTDVLKIIYYAPVSERTNVLFDGYSPLLASLHAINKWKEYKWTKKHPMIIGYLGFFPLYKQKEDIVAMSDEQFRVTYYDTVRTDNSFFDDINRSEFIEFFKEFAKTGTKVIFVSSLKLNSTHEGGFEFFLPTIHELSPSSYYTINLNDKRIKEDLSLTKSDFSDLNHLTHAGALKVTEFLAPMISEIIYENDGRSTNQRNMEQENTGLLKDYNIILEDYYQKTIQLYLDSLPADLQDTIGKIEVYLKAENHNGLTNTSLDKEPGPLVTAILKSDFTQTEKAAIATIFLNKHLKKDMIDRIDISMVDPVSTGSTLMVSISRP